MGSISDLGPYEPYKNMEVIKASNEEREKRVNALLKRMREGHEKRLLVIRNSNNKFEIKKED